MIQPKGRKGQKGQKGASSQITKRKSREEFSGEKRAYAQTIQELCCYWFISRSGCYARKCNFLHPQGHVGGIPKLCSSWQEYRNCTMGKKCQFFHPFDPHFDPETIPLYNPQAAERDKTRSQGGAFGDSNGQKWTFSNNMRKQPHYKKIPNGNGAVWNKSGGKNKTVLFRNTPEIYHRQHRTGEGEAFSLPASSWSSNKHQKTSREEAGENDQKKYELFDEVNSSENLSKTSDSFQSNQNQKLLEEEAKVKRKSKSKRDKAAADKFFCSFLNSDAKENVSVYFCKNKSPCNLSTCELAHDEQGCLDLLQRELPTLKLPAWGDLKVQYCTTPSCGQEQYMTLGSLSHNQYRNYEKVTIGLQCRACVKYQEKCYFQTLKQKSLDSYLIFLFAQANRCFFLFFYCLISIVFVVSLFMLTEKGKKKEQKLNDNYSVLQKNKKLIPKPTTLAPWL